MGEAVTNSKRPQHYDYDISATYSWSYGRINVVTEQIGLLPDGTNIYNKD
jgi:hypothetical protein